MANRNKRDAIHDWKQQAEIPNFETLAKDDTIMGRGFCNGDCHTCPDLNQCALDFDLDD
jgi:hypothetical protein